MYKKCFKVDIYSNVKVTVIITDKPLEVPLVAKCEIDDYFNALTISNKDGYFVIINSFRIENHYSTIPHEALHIVYGILNNAGFTYTQEGEEAYTYLLGYICRNMFKIWDDYKNSLK